MEHKKIGNIYVWNPTGIDANGISWSYFVMYVFLGGIKNNTLSLIISSDIFSKQPYTISHVNAECGDEKLIADHNT